MNFKMTMMKEDKERKNHLKIFLIPQDFISKETTV